MPAFDVRNDPYCRLKDTACTLDISACFRWFQFNTHLTHFTFFFRRDNSDSSFSFINDATFHFTELLPLLPLFPSFRITSAVVERRKTKRLNFHTHAVGQITNNPVDCSIESDRTGRTLEFPRTLVTFLRSSVRARSSSFSGYTCS